MAVPMMQIGHMWVGVFDPVVPVRMRMGFRTFIAVVVVEVVLVMDVPVIVLQGLMQVGVGVLDSDEKPCSRDHEHSADCCPEAGNLS